MLSSPYDYTTTKYSTWATFKEHPNASVDIKGSNFDVHGYLLIGMCYVSGDVHQLLISLYIIGLNLKYWYFNL